MHFPPPTRLSSLLPDATDPEQSPGEPFVRRMWAGGQIDFDTLKSKKLRLVGVLSTCLERISDVIIKGLPGEEKAFVTIERRFSGSKPERYFYDNGGSQGTKTGWYDAIARKEPERVRNLLLDDMNCSIIERRNLVFMRKHTLDSTKEASKSVNRVIKPLHEPDVSHTITPTPNLLFRFSALTFNAHSIHLNKQYCREIEGHRNLLVHGPLSLVLILEVLGRHLASKGMDGRVYPSAQLQVTSVEYRNIAPLYAEEAMKICCRDRGDGQWDVWIEGPHGGYAVKGVAKVQKKSILSKTCSRPQADC